MKLLLVLAFAAVAGGADRVVPEPLWIALLQTDAYLGQIESEAEIVYQSADRLARATAPARAALPPMHDLKDRHNPLNQPPTPPD